MVYFGGGGGGLDACGYAVDLLSLFLISCLLLFLPKFPFPQVES